MLAVIHLMFVVMITPLAQIPATMPAENWMGVYSTAVRLEVGEGDLAEAADAYRRVLVSRAPDTYKHAAKYRLAQVLGLMGKVSEKKAILEALQTEAASGKLTDSLAARAAKDLTAMAAAEGGKSADLGPLKQALVAHDFNEIREAARALATAEGPDGVQALLGAYQLEAEGSRTKGVLLEVLGESGWPEALTEIRQALRGKNAGSAAYAVGLIGDARSGPKLIELLGDEDADVRQSAIRGLHLLRYVPAVDLLIEMARNDPDEDVRAEAVTALQAIGTARAVKAVASQPVHDPAWVFATWYREARLAKVATQQGFAPIGKVDPDRPVRIGVLVSAMTHYAPQGRRGVCYLRQIRKAWVLQRAGFDVCLLTEPEVLADATARGLGELFQPTIPVYGLGRWPACDAVVIDQISYLPAEVVQAVLGYVRAGGKVVVCGAAGGVWCGDTVSLRELVGVRFPHWHNFRDEAVVLSWSGVTGNGDRDTGAEGPSNERLAASSERLAAGGGNSDDRIPRLPTLSLVDWPAHRGGTYFSHEAPSGEVLAILQTPAVWAIKVQDVGRGRVLCINWDIGLNTEASRDEDQLFCRCVDIVMGEAGHREGVRYAMMRHERWGRLAEAKECISRERIAELDGEERIETLMQLCRLYRMENNETAGEAACRRLLGETADGKQVRAMMAEAMRRTFRVQVTSLSDGEILWWRDVPEWLVTSRGAPLWLAGPGQVPAAVRVRVGLPASKEGANCALRMTVDGAKIASVHDVPAGVEVERKGNTCQFSWKGDGASGAWADVEMTLERMDARVKVD